MREINLRVVDGVACEIPYLNPVRLRAPYRSRRSNSRLVGADDSHFGEAQPAGVVPEHFPPTDLQVAHGQRERVCAFSEFIQRLEIA